MHPGHLRPVPRGFTLVELLVSIAVLGVLVAIALPSWTSYQHRTRVNQAQRDIVTMAGAIGRRALDERTLPRTLADAGIGAMQDPWGRPYVYLPLDEPRNMGLARKDHALVPINTDFDLYSQGPDGVSRPPLTAPQSRDDIVRANDGAFVGVADDY